jgi:hypothetical protein
MQDFRALPLDFPCGDIRAARELTLILVKPAGTADWAHDRAGKDALVSAFEPTADLLLMAWTGQWRTDIFRLTAEDLERYYRLPQAARCA